MSFQLHLAEQNVQKTLKDDLHIPDDKNKIKAGLNDPWPTEIAVILCEKHYKYLFLQNFIMSQRLNARLAHEPFMFSKDIIIAKLWQYISQNPNVCISRVH